MPEKKDRLFSADVPVQAAFASYINIGKLMADKAGLNWDMVLDDVGIAKKGQEWDLRRLVNDGNPAQAKLKTFSMDGKAMAVMAKDGLLVAPTWGAHAVSRHWQDLIKAYTLHHLLVSGLSIGYLQSVYKAIRLLGTVLDGKQPWQADADDIRRSMAIAKSLSATNQYAIVIAAFVKSVIDAYHLSEACPLAPMIGSERGAGPGRFRAAKFTLKGDELRERLAERKSEEKLPEKKAFWELMRIVFTEKPRTFTDAIRFAQAKVVALTGLRIGEVTFLPLDWKRTLEYRDRDGTLAGDHGGFSRALFLRHFAEKQGSSRREMGSLYENTQFVPLMFEDILVQTLGAVERLTAPMREILKAQCETGRLLPMYPPDTLLSAEVCYLHLTGNVLFREVDEAVRQPYIDRYRNNLDLSALDELIDVQRRGNTPARQTWLVYAIRMRRKGIVFRNADGTPWCGRGPANQFLRVADLEDYIRTEIPTKISDTHPFRLDGGTIVRPWEFLFLLPKRALAEERNAMPCHLGWNLGVTVSTPEILGNSISGTNSADYPTLFNDYGLTDADRSLTLKSHSLRHLQNTELFRLGVADTIITKRFNRRSVAQSYEYDHRSLQEELEQITLPEEWEAYLGPKAASVAKLVEAGRANGPIVREFRRLRASEGDEAAYSFLKAEADGFHATPYGHCLNSFTVDPCPTHLECFNGCRHLSATNLPENRQHLMRLQGKIEDALSAAHSKPTTSIGRENQSRHAEIRLAGIDRLLATPTGERAFPDGQDLSLSNIPPSVLHGPSSR
jgi:hypothetical protein